MLLRASDENQSSVHRTQKQIYVNIKFANPMILLLHVLTPNGNNRFLWFVLCVELCVLCEQGPKLCANCQLITDNCTMTLRNWMEWAVGGGQRSYSAN